MIGNVNKSDKLDAKGLNMLQRTGTLPTVWIPPSGVRDARELPRTRMVFSRQRTQLKNRVHATLSKYGYVVDEVSDAFGKRAARSSKNCRAGFRLILNKLSITFSISSTR